MQSDDNSQETLTLGNPTASQQPESDGTAQTGLSAQQSLPGLPIIARDKYRIESELARGGLGRVSVARDHRLGRRVAIKEMLRRRKKGYTRFVREVMLTARLQHPGIVPVYEAGYWPDGSPFYSMKLVSGRTLEERIGEAGSVADRLALLGSAIAVAHAIAYAHSQRIIHRDLKPENIILGEFGETVVVDWGLAKDLDATQSDEVDAEVQNPEQTNLTRAGSVLGTPRYMPPEQAAGQPVDERADIYALGAILYYIVTGRAPYQDSAGIEVVDEVRAGRPRAIRECAPDAPIELCAIIDRAMAREPSERYPSAKHLAEDLERFQNGQLVSAHRYSLTYLSTRWIVRHRALVAVTALLLGALLTTAVISVQRIVKQRDMTQARYLEAQAAKQVERQRSDELRVARAALEHEPTAAIAWLQTLPVPTDIWPLARLVATRARNHGVAQHVWRDHEGSLSEIELSPDGRYLATANTGGNVHLRDLHTGRSQILKGHQWWVYRVAFSPTEPRLASASRDGTVRLWTTDGQLLRTLDDHQAPVQFVLFSPDGRLLASGDKRGRVHVRDLRSGARQILTGSVAGVWQLAFSTDGAHLAAGHENGEVRVWSAASAQARPASGQVPDRPFHADSLVLEGHTEFIHDLTFSADGSLLASASYDDSARVWTVATGQERARYPHDADVRQVRFIGASHDLVTTGLDGQVRVWPSAGPARTLGRHAHGVYTLEVSADGRYLATGDSRGDLRVWDLAEHRLHRQYVAPIDLITDLAFDRTGTTLWSAGRSSGIRQWQLDTATARAMVPAAPGDADQSLALVPAASGRQVFSGHASGRVVMWSPESGAVRELADTGEQVHHLALSTDGQSILSVTATGAMAVHEVATGATRTLGTHRTKVYSLARAPDNDRFATSSDDGVIGLWHLDPGAQPRWLGGHDGRVWQVAFGADSNQLASAGSDGQVRLWNIAAGGYIPMGEHAGGAHSLAFSRDGRFLASGGVDQRVRVHALGSDEVQILDGHRRTIDHLAFSPDGRHLASLSKNDRFVFVWQLDVGQATRLNVQDAYGMAWSGDSQRLAVISEDTSVSLWDVGSARGQVLARRPLAANTVVYADDGKTLLVGDRSGEVSLWHDDLPTDAADFRAWLNAATTADISPGTFLASPRASGVPVE